MSRTVMRRNTARHRNVMRRYSVMSRCNVVPLRGAQATAPICHSHPVSFSCWMTLAMMRTQPRKPAPCFFCTFLWFQTLRVIESERPRYLRCTGSAEQVKGRPHGTHFQSCTAKKAYMLPKKHKRFGFTKDKAVSEGARPTLPSLHRVINCVVYIFGWPDVSRPQRAVAALNWNRRRLLPLRTRKQDGSTRATTAKWGVGIQA